MKVLICDGLVAEAVEKIKAAGHEVDLRKGITAEELLERADDIECLVVRSATKVTAEIMSRCPNLKLVCRGGVGLDNVDLVAAKAKGIIVRNTPACTSISVAEHALGLMICAARNIPQGYSAMKGGGWDRKTFSGTELYAKTLGLVGFGRIGRELAKRALAMGMKVVAHDPYARAEDIKELGCEVASALPDLLGRSDFISLHLPITDETLHMVNADFLEQCKTGAILINTARGPLLDEPAVARALKMGKLRAAALDVYEVEPPPKDHPLVHLPNVITLPHLGASTAEGQTRAGMDIAGIILNFQHG